GNSKNCKAFRKRVFGEDLSDDIRPTWSGRERPRTLWQWRRRQNEVDARKAFGEAQAAFKAIEEQVLDRQKELQVFADLHRDVLDRRLESRFDELKRKAHSTKTELDALVQGILEK